MTNVEQTQNQRQAYRFAVGGSGRGELILADKSRWPVRLLDQSASGFGVLSDGPTPISPGDTAQLQTEFLCSRVRVVYMTEIEPGSADGESTPVGARLRLGLVRLGDLAVAEDEPKEGRRWTPWRCGLPSDNRNQIALLLAMFALPVIVLVIVGLLFYTHSSLGPAIRSVTGDPRPLEETLRSRYASPGSPEGAASSAGVKSRRNLGLDSNLDDLRHLPGALPFVTGGVIRELQLTDAQLAKIRAILDNTDKAIAANKAYRLLLESARQEAMDLLNEQQRQRWAVLSGADTSSTVSDRP